MRESGLLRPGYHNTTLSWSRNGNNTGRITLEVHILPDSEPCIRLKYTYDKTIDLDYYVTLEALPSHEHRPGRYRMHCPISGKPATVLYLHGGTGYFAHRLAYPGHRLYYDSQLTPHRLRALVRPFLLDRKVEDAYMSKGKNRKTHYRGKPTRWYAQLQALEAKADRATFAGVASLGLGGQFDPFL
ncbi:hypothetical protein [Hymenobacter bucti]|uniref:Acetyl xylan esterase domain-containing protein n=1 Tax=Hymenobacter bucti TaxID=1844114 RepID=A0ABW4QXB6_9BACT